GGGSRTDLFYFDELSISKAIALARVPVITGIGHETDLSVADMAANRHLVTPTDTAKFLVERCDDLSERIEKAQAKMCALSEYILERAKQQSGALSQRLAMRSQYMTSQEFSGLRDIAYRMHAATIKGLNRHGNHLQGLRSTMPGALRLVSEKDKSRINMLYLKMDIAWSRIIEHADKEIQDMNKTLEKSASAIFEHAFEYMDHTKKTLALINPETIFKRGYSITLDHKGKPLKNAREVSVGEDLTTILHQGRITSIVKDREQK
ncbi:MAG: exodeoxyribonuclease VII large subunit, partial [Thermodesulfobacteriota bacterium]|nr:exodeoxyribonuclease VII large subunit [Thermodesulfobacteriota bacterium]